MPVVTRSCTKDTKQKGRPRIEDKTPATTANTNRSCRYITRSTAKRKILQQDHEGKDVEPPSKKVASTRTCKKTSNQHPIQEVNNDTNKKGDAKSNKCRTKKTSKNKTMPLPSNTQHLSKKNDGNKSQRGEKSMSHLNSTLDGSETVTKTPAGYIATRIRSYSALRRSQWRKNNSSQSVNTCSIENGMLPSGEFSLNPWGMETDTDSDEDVLWKMGRQHSPEEKEDLHESMSGDERSYKKKYYTLMTAMRQLQNTFLKAQKNAERNVKAHDKFNKELKSSLKIEKQKTSLLSEELLIKKGTVERLRSDLENAKEQLQCLREEKMTIEKHNMEKSEKEININHEIPGGNETSLLQRIEDQKHVIRFYSQLTGVSISSDNPCEDTSSFQSFNCTFFPAANTAHCLQFRLTHDKEFDEVEYSPNPQSPGSEDVLLSLPKYLQENIFFGAEQAPRFLAKLITTAKK